MTIIFFILILILLLTTTVLLVVMALSSERRSDPFWQTLLNGFNHALRDSGFQEPSHKQKVPYFRWIPGPGACEESHQRAHWPSMDIIDWMKEGLPGTPEMRNKCGQQCHCRLINAPKESRKHNPPGAI
jgi:hypothetical protein